MKKGKTRIVRFLLVLLLFSTVKTAFTQVCNCNQAIQVCFDYGAFMFSATVNSGSGEVGPNYGCLSTTPNPTWFFLRIDEPGSITLDIRTNPSHDVDFCCWGPFDNPITPCPYGLTGNKVVSCSYSSDPNETCEIPSSAQSGEFYILVVTNYSNLACSIRINQTGGTGSVDCETGDIMISATSEPAEGGTVIGSGLYYAGSNCLLHATPNLGYRFLYWMENDTVVSTDEYYSFMVEAPRSLVAVFEWDSENYTVSVAANPDLGGMVTGGGSFLQGEACTVSASPASGYRFIGWREDGVFVYVNRVYTFTVTRSRVLEAVFEWIDYPTDDLFSVQLHHKVSFSPGNLQYQASTNTWRFANIQYEYLGSENASISSDNEGWIDLFGWGTSGHDQGVACYQPWSTSTDYHCYYSGESLTGLADWGTNAISNAENPYGWRTLTYEEWNYLFFGRSTPSQLRFAKATVDNTPGVIILPDAWVASVYPLNHPNEMYADFGSNSLSSEEWLVLEEQGAVFLPAAGYRKGVTVYEAGTTGQYWTSRSQNEIMVWCLSFDEGLSLTPLNCYSGRSVRLVRNAYSAVSETQEAVNIYPNPVTDVLSIEAEGITHVAVYNLVGQCVLDMETDGDIVELPCEALSTGMYLIRVNTLTTAFSQRVIIR